MSVSIIYLARGLFVDSVQAAWALRVAPALAQT